MIARQRKAVSRRKSRADKRKRKDQKSRTAEMSPSPVKAAEREAHLLRELEAVRLENLRLRQEIDEMEKQTASSAPIRSELPFSKSKSNTPQEEWNIRFSEGSRIAQDFSKRSYPRYLFGIINSSSAVRIFRKISAIFRKARLVSLIITASVTVSTAVLLIPIYLIALAVMALLTGLTAFCSMFFASRMNKRLRGELTGKHLYVFVVSDPDTLKPDSFFCGNARRLAENPDCAVLVVSPHNLGREGLGGKRFYLTARQEAERLYIVRRHYFFNVRRRVLTQSDPRMTVIY